MEWMVMVMLCFDAQPDTCVLFVDPSEPLVYESRPACLDQMNETIARAHSFTSKTAELGSGPFTIDGRCVRQIDSHEPEA